MPLSMPMPTERRLEVVYWRSLVMITGSVSSSMSFQSEMAFRSWDIPVLSPADTGEYLEFGAYGYALSRFTGLWCGFKAVTEVVESSRSVNPDQDWRFVHPEFTPSPTGLH